MIDSSLPGADMVQQGIRDLEAGVRSIPAFLVSMAPTKLRLLGLEVPEETLESPEMGLYELLALEHGDGAHSKYNSWRRQLVSFMRAAACVK